MICQVCDNAFDGLESMSPSGMPSRYRPHHENFSSLASSAKNGCPVCVRLNLHADRFLRDGGSEASDLFKCSTCSLSGSFLDESKLPKSFEVSVHIERSDNRYCPRMKYSVTKLARVPPHIVWTDPPRSNFSESDESLVQAQKWIHNCISSHPKCSKGSGPSPAILPSRLLHIENGPPSTIRLVDVHDKQDVEYLALSYCWGASKNYTLTESTVAALRSGIPTADLHKTYRDAVVVAQRLGISKLWIDALCIFQDSLKSWQTESSKMHHIYGNSVCCVAATSASDVSVGLFYDREPMLVNTFTETLTVRDFNVKEKIYLFVPRADWQDAVDRGPLNKRGWVLQERVLSRRILHFGRDQLYWECKELGASETFPGGMDDIGDICLGERRFKGLDPEINGEELRLSEREKNPEYNIYRLWNRIVETYTSCALTKRGDKLVAILGIAKHLTTYMQSSGSLAKSRTGSAISRFLTTHMRSRRSSATTKPSPAPTQGDGYLAGLWAAALPFQLMWRVGYRGTRDSSYIAPSWSWASMDVPVFYPHHFSGDPSIFIISTGTTPVGDDNMAQISDGYIRLECYLFSLASQVKLENVHEQDGYNRYVSDTGEFEEFESIYCLPVLRFEYALAGLLIRNIGKGRNVRVGYFEFRRAHLYRSGGQILQDIIEDAGLSEKRHKGVITLV